MGRGAAVYRLENNETSWSKKPIKQFFAKIFSRGTYARGVGEVASRKNHFVLPGYILDAIPVFSAFPFSFKPHPAFPLPKGVVKFKRLGVTL